VKCCSSQKELNNFN